jgi:tripartite-type tricarboxylate transporter receptor subunit TctC
MFDNIASSLEPLQSGKVRALAVTTRQRCAVMPELPPIWDVLPGYETAGFYGTAVPRGTPQDIVALLNREINLAIADPIVRKQFDAVGATPVTCSTRDCGGVFAAEIVRWRQLIKLARVSRDG